jgi:epoxyqueuosine reductase
MESASIAALTQQIKQQALGLGFHKVGIARVTDWESPNGPQPFAEHLDQRINVHRLQSWLDQGHQADMNWMNSPKRQDIRQVMPEVKSVICLALNYYAPVPRPIGSDPSHSGSTGEPEATGSPFAKISRYGWGRDYHRVLHGKLKAFSAWLEAQGDGTAARYYADTGPVQDKLWAQRAGLGWVAKNSNVITRDYGSWVFLGELLTNLDLEPDPPHGSHCGTCTRCLEACPTDAIVAPFVVDANRCIAYHTIENRSPELPADLDLQGWVAGCDICQDVCPWNRFAQATDVPDFQPYPWNVAPLLTELADLSQEDYERRFPASALRRIKPAMMRRNARANLTRRPRPADRAADRAIIQPSDQQPD